TKPGRGRTIGKNMAKVGAAPGAMDFCAGHSVVPVDRFFDRALDRPGEAWPAGAALKLDLAFEERLAAGRASENPGALFMEERATARPFGAVLSHDLVLLRGEQGAPFGFGVGDRVLFGLRRGCFAHVELLFC